MEGTAQLRNAARRQLETATQALRAFVARHVLDEPAFSVRPRTQPVGEVDPEHRLLVGRCPRVVDEPLFVRIKPTLAGNAVNVLAVEATAPNLCPLISKNIPPGRDMPISNRKNPSLNGAV